MHKVDFMGVQYYGSQPMQGFGVAPIPGFPFLKGLPVRCQASSPTCSDFNQDIDPGGFREVLEIASSYKLADGSKVPLWVTENGIADAGDSKRPPYIVNHIAVVQDLVAHGTDIRGYTYWSFVDNLEWVRRLRPRIRPLRVRPDDARARARRRSRPASRRSAMSPSTTNCCCPCWLSTSRASSSGREAATGAASSPPGSPRC